MGLFGFIGGLLGSGGQKKAADKASQLQYEAAMAGVKETGRQFDITEERFAPYAGLGADAVPRMSALMGLDGDEAQQMEIAGIKAGPLYTSLYNNGRDTILANASATGGLRGGNTQEGLARFGGDTLNSVIAQQLANYGGAIGVGTGATGAVANFGANAVSDQNMMRNQGAGAKAQAVLTKAGINAKNWQNAGNMLDENIGSVTSMFKSIF